AQPASRHDFRIGFHFWKPGKIYDEAYQGVVDGLALEAIRYKSFIFNANRDEALARKNLKTLDGMGLDLIVSFSSAGTKIAQSMQLRTPLIATVVNHPMVLGIQKEEEANGSSITGTSYYVDAEQHLLFYREMFPRLSRVDMIYDTNNPAGFQAEEPLMRKACERLGLVFLSEGIVGKKDLPTAAQALADAKADIIVIPTNRQVYANLQNVLDITHAHQIPVVSMNKQGVEYGALAALFADTYKLGRLMAPIAGQILIDKKKPAEIPFKFIAQPDLIINLKEARNLDYEFNPSILGKASIVLD
ncbi:MAG: hypothetical protein L3J79_04435, partial [Candidatus Marinimicrobia bacterium]|nr:hypothetical protein [Candidatus Neomarinimicrobiota bacterium]